MCKKNGFRAKEARHIRINVSNYSIYMYHWNATNPLICFHLINKLSTYQICEMEEIPIVMNSKETHLCIYSPLIFLNGKYLNETLRKNCFARGSSIYTK